MIRPVRRLIEWVHQSIPKKNYAVIYGWPDFEDSTLALEQALQGTDLEKVILLNSGNHSAPQGLLGSKTISVRKNSFKGLWLFLKAKYAFFTHPCFVRKFPDDVVSVNIWHGMPIKRIGLMLDTHWEIHASHTLATSPF